MTEAAVPITRSWLESLSTPELIKMADNYGIDIPPGLERIFIIEELLECANAEIPKTEDEIKINPSYHETALLPKQYNISFIEVIIRDPLWAFVFWEIKSHDRELHEGTDDFGGYCLRIITLDAAQRGSKENSFTVSLGIEDRARYIGFAEQSLQDSNSYVILLNAIRGEKEIQIASSAPFNMPGIKTNGIISNLSQNPLICLSGLQNISIIRNIDRDSRKILSHNRNN